MDNDKTPETEFPLIGRFWLGALIGVLCALVAAYMFMHGGRPWIGNTGWAWHAAGVSYRTREVLYGAIFAMLAVACFGWCLLGPWLARRILMTGQGLTVFEPPILSKPPVMIPYPAIGNLRRYQQSSPTRRGNYSSKALETIGFTFQGRPYGFQRYRFRNDQEFESFWRLMTERVRSVTRAE
ncbi:hypothetical protein [Paraburkholderia sp. SIMBA_030]|uniref:hypothetical protein n=1 Tax=Paraburkholderia sp. SIMBA_030 TaxID=3085773 RepID=UPI00397B5069